MNTREHTRTVWVPGQDEEFATRVANQEGWSFPTWDKANEILQMPENAKSLKGYKVFEVRITATSSKVTGGSRKTMKRIWSWFARLLTWRPAAFRKRLPTEVGIPCLKPEERQPYKRVPRTCMLVHPGNRDTYAEMLERLPPLVAEGPYDVYEGNPNPAVVAELSRYPEFYPDQNAPNPRCPVARFQKTK